MAGAGYISVPIIRFHHVFAIFASLKSDYPFIAIQFARYMQDLQRDNTHSPLQESQGRLKGFGFFRKLPSLDRAGHGFHSPISIHSGAARCGSRPFRCPWISARAVTSKWNLGVDDIWYIVNILYIVEICIGVNCFIHQFVGETCVCVYRGAFE